MSDDQSTPGGDDDMGSSARIEPPEPTPRATPGDAEEKLAELDALHDFGALTDDEFDEQKPATSPD